MLIGKDELVEQLRIVALESFGNAGVLTLDLVSKLERHCTHINLTDGRIGAEDAAGNKFFKVFGQIHKGAQPFEPDHELVPEGNSF